MGPKNSVKVQQKLRDIALTLGAPAGQLPQSRTYTVK
jgi:hypothetical protein